MASKRRLRRKSCEGKRVYPQEADAKRMAYLQYQNTGERVFEYKCHFCGQWHIGHLSRKLREAKQRRNE